MDGLQQQELPKIGAKRKYCDHCNRSVSNRTYNAHKRRQRDSLPTTSNESAEEYTDHQSDSSDFGFDFSDDESADESGTSQIITSDNLPSPASDSDQESQSSSHSLSDTSANEEEFSCYDTSSSDEDLDQGAEDVVGGVVSSAVVKMIVLFLMTWKKLFNISDAAICVLLSFLKKFLGLLATISMSGALLKISNCFPDTLFTVRKYLGINRDNFQQYVVCPKCSSCYKPEDCMKVVFGRMKGKHCSFVEFPNHPRRLHRRPCGASLMKAVRSSNGTINLKARRVYCYRSVKESFKELLCHPGFLEKCNEWRNRQQDDELLGDVYDGRVWRNFKNNDGQPFFDSPNTFGCMVNLDWFQPYKDSMYSVGVLYLSFLNLPPGERNKEENIVVVGIIPGPREPSRHVNPFLDPFVSELVDLWEGIWIRPRKSSTGPLFCRLAIICITCDIPASRKLCGFLGFCANRGCNKCDKIFPRRSGKQDFSGFDRPNWTLSNNATHRRQVWTNINRGKTKQDRSNLEKNSGVRFSSLIYLPYFDFISFVVVDPMHNLLLGTTKKMLKIWKERDIIREKQFEDLQERVNKLKVPSTIGRIPTKIASSFNGFTADQFKNWTIIFSVFAMTDVLPTAHLQCWKLFVRACRILCSTIISKADVKLADELLLKFCKSVQHMYGTAVITPNMHLHLHLSECVLDYGPVYGFWCFSFERFNGIMGSFHVNNHQIEVQLMRKFIERQELVGMEWPEAHLDFKGLFVQQERGSLAETKSGCLTPVMYRESLQLQKYTGDNLHHLSFTDKPFFKALSRIRDFYISDDEVDSLFEMYTTLHDEDSIVLVPKFCKRFSKLLLHNHTVSAVDRGSEQSACILARWRGTSGLDTASQDLRPGVVQYFIQHIITVRTATGTTRDLPYTLACVHWYKVHPHKRYYFGLPIQVCLPNYEHDSGAAYIPVSRIASVCAAGEMKYNLKTQNGRESIVVTVPLDFKTHI